MMFDEDDEAILKPLQMILDPLEVLDASYFLINSFNFPFSLFWEVFSSSIKKRLQGLRMLSSATLIYQVTKILWIQVLNCQYCNQCLKCLQDCLFNCQKGKSNCLNCQNCHQLSKIVKNCTKLSKNVKNVKIVKMVRIVKNCQNCQKM